MSNTPPWTGRPPDPTKPGEGIGRTRLSGLWVGMVLSAVVLVLLLIFILQNRASVEISFLSWTGVLPTGIALLLSAVAGALAVALPGSARMLQLRRAVHRDGDRPRRRRT